MKFGVFDFGASEEMLISGKMDGSALKASDGNGRKLIDEPLELADRDLAMRRLFGWLRSEGHVDGFAGIGYRIVHGGARYSEPVLIGPDVLKELKRITPLAPDHLPDQIATIERIEKLMPGTPEVACFDTAFHRTMPRHAQVYGLTSELADEGVVRYGFHGLSYSFITGRMRSEGTLPERLIVAHLGNGASMAAIRGGRSIDTSMGLTPTGGFLMSNRSGDLDPGVILLLLREKKMSVEQIAELVNQAGGLKGLSGISSDMQTLEKQSPETVKVFCYQVKKFLGAYMAALGGADAVVFTGGIGENSSTVRAGICEGLDRLGIELDHERNRAGDDVISSEHSRVTVRVMKTNEEIVIARSTAAVLAKVSVH